MNLAIDVGNTFVKAGVFENGRLISFYSSLNESQLQKLSGEINVENLIVSSVGKDPDISFSLFPAVKNKICLNHSTALPFKNIYKTPHTLGMDRIAGAAGVVAISPGVDKLVIDAGTCITYDFTDRNEQYHGGGISPGINMRFKALNTFTQKLPLISQNNQFSLIGGNTEESILSGVLNGIISEVNGVILQYKEKYPQIKIFLCGGDASFFESKIKEPIFAVPELVLIGLNRILEHNVSEV